MMLTRTEANLRVTRFQERLAANGVQAALLLIPVDIFYFTGTRQNSALWIPASGEPMLLVRKSLVRAKAEGAIDDIRAFHATYYRPDNAVLVVSGNFDPAQLNRWVDQYFANIKRPAAARTPPASSARRPRPPQLRRRPIAPAIATSCGTTGWRSTTTPACWPSSRNAWPMGKAPGICTASTLDGTDAS